LFSNIDIGVDVKYASYLARQDAEIARFRESEHVVLPPDLDYSQVVHLSIEGIYTSTIATFLFHTIIKIKTHAEKEKLERIRPATLGAAGRISGMTPSSLVALLRFAQHRSNRAARNNVESD
jgi:tRNA uridine 5-carboxymethylaminomethyl modification enzyme